MTTKTRITRLERQAGKASAVTWPQLLAYERVEDMPADLRAGWEAFLTGRGYYETPAEEPLEQPR